jgi:hypothetical protein
VLPNAFISRDPELSRILEPVWEESRMRGVNPQGASFWIRIVRTGGGDSPLGFGSEFGEENRDEAT